MFLWRSLQPEALTLLLRVLATRSDRRIPPAAGQATDGSLARPGQAGQPKDGRATLITPKA